MATATATAATQKEESPRKTAHQERQPPSTTKDGDESKISAAEEPVSSVQKRIRRAERFGLPVQLSEEEKRNTRAERFGTGTGSVVHGSHALKQSEEHKRKARAERFGIVQSVPYEEAKKKARPARFGAVPKTDPLEEDKKKARAIRFSQPPSGSLSQVNGEGNNIEMAAAVGKAGGGT
ncbi:protein MODIFIER OF SNC1 11-like isoform X2 [Actinidia eriantha]|uniref:protein MODIFIER OF SNC1 11-like isoform X2 n=1 Tax=Actinidia eriantha TaxID=165200 RepID=UPI00258B10D4|nr:protein MODIFIER OF SNC1 11-like isoform X2 [Actinidia eriantha]XP_057461646.1 protein MODIFIER OF SNC1 11-like isoform X2 [Actinidia eriantha]